MEIKQNILNCTKISFCGFGLIITFCMVIELTYFLSVPNFNLKLGITDNDSWLRISWALLCNMTLLSLFILQHSVLASQKIKSIFSTFSLQDIYRSLYVITTAGILLILVRHWQNIPEIILWKFNLNYRPLWWLYGGIHAVAWIIIYVGNICADVTELLGIKQVYYSIANLPSPDVRKSLQLQRLNAHMRHPSFLAFIFIFWLFPIMSLDRLLLSTILTTYMYIAWNTDERDYNYHRYQYERKHHELERLQRYSY